jgi:hypothetical protein
MTEACREPMKRSRRQTRTPAKRNPLAKALRSGIYAKPRVVEPADRYKRRPKHPRRPAEGEDEP